MSPANLAAVGVHNMNNTLGAAFIGNIIGAMQVSIPSIYLVSDLIMTSLFRLFGITTLQVFIYFQGSPQDRMPFKLLVRKQHLHSISKMFILKFFKIAFLWFVSFFDASIYLLF